MAWYYGRVQMNRNMHTYICIWSDRVRASVRDKERDIRRINIYRLRERQIHRQRERLKTGRKDI